MFDHCQRYRPRTNVLGLLLAFGLAAVCVEATGAEDRSAEVECTMVDLDDAFYGFFVWHGGRYVCYAVRDEPCEVWDLELIEDCGATVTLTYLRPEDELGVVTLDRKTANVLSIERVTSVARGSEFHNVLE